MKILVLINLMLFSVASFAVEFYRCIDTNGKAHLTTLPKSSLDRYCKQKTDHYALLLQQDYLNLANEFKKYEMPDAAETDGNGTATPLDMITKPVINFLDADNALDELLKNTQQKRNSPVTKFFRARTNAIESILSEDKPNTPLNNEQ